MAGSTRKVRSYIMVFFAIVMMVIIFILSIISVIEENKNKKDAEELRQALDELQKIKSEPFDDDYPPNVRIIILQQRLSKLVSCDLCPWYLTHSLKNTQTEFQEEIK